MSVTRIFPKNLEYLHTAQQKIILNYGWLDSFKKRSILSFNTVCGESGFMDAEAENFGKDNSLKIILGRDAEDIFNNDMTGLFFKCISDKTLTFKAES